MTDMLEEIKVTIGQASHDGEYHEWVDASNRCRFTEPYRQLNAVYKTVETAKQDQSQFVIFPELFQPRQFLRRHIASICEENNFIMIGGLEYGPEYIPGRDREVPLQNEAYIAIPSSLTWGSAPDSHKRRKCTLLTIPKILPAEEEAAFLNQNRYKFKGGSKLYLFQSKIVGNWAVLICSDFLNLPIHVLLQSSIQTLFVISYNKDVNAYSSIADTIQRISMCNVIICNIGNYGSSLAYSPYRKDFKRNILKVTGNHIDVAITITFPLEKLARAQNGEHLTDRDGSQLFIKRPPDFGKYHVIKTN